MKTTIDIPDGLATEAKRVARERGTTLRDLVVVGLHRQITEQERTPSEADFVLHTFTGHGLQPGVGPGDLVDRSYELTDRA